MVRPVAASDVQSNQAKSGPACLDAATMVKFLTMHAMAWPQQMVWPNALEL
jgi:hypothetical protein